MKCDRKKTCHAVAEVAVHGKVTLLLCFEPLSAHPVSVADSTPVHIDRIVGVGFVA
jgi:hypothetical protein